MLPVNIDGRKIAMELETGAALSIINEAIWRKVGKPRLVPVNYDAESYTGGKIAFKGQCTVEMQVGNVRQVVQLHVLERNAPSIFGRDLQVKVGLSLNDLKSLAQREVFVVNIVRTSERARKSAVSSGKTCDRQKYSSKVQDFQKLEQFCDKKGIKLSYSPQCGLLQIPNKQLAQELGRGNVDSDSIPREFLAGKKDSPDFVEGMTVYARCYKEPVKWFPGRIMERTSDTTYRVHTSTGDWIRRADQLRERPRVVMELDFGKKEEHILDISQGSLDTTQGSLDTKSSESTSLEPTTQEDVQCRRSTRRSRPPERYSPYVRKTANKQH